MLILHGRLIKFEKVLTRIISIMNFSQIPGQKDIKTKLLRSVKEERVSHAQLFSGTEGCGSMALALAYARYISRSEEHTSELQSRSWW
jgi:DNA polymerase III gamma/tau subunit